MELELLYHFVGGPYNGLLLNRKRVEEIAPINGYTKDLSEIREKGDCVHRKELDNQPKISGFAGPMWDGIRYEINGKLEYDFRLTEEQKAKAGHVYGIIRYETWDVYDVLSR